ncbi:MAG: serine--tRNA ligase [Alphaproteobacteria bacterium]|nr:serine--tRNA ligase [Alphaproteobacteria bacterium]
MFDIKWIRENPGAFDDGLAKRGLDPTSETIIDLDKTRRKAQTHAQAIQEERNKLSKQIGTAKSKGEDAEALLKEVSASKKSQDAAENIERERSGELKDCLMGIPNLPDASVPVGPDEAANETIREWGEKPELGFEPKQHYELGEALGLMDFERAAKLSGSRFVVLYGALSRLERALGAFMLDLQTGEFGYRETSPPVLVRNTALLGTGQLPKFAADQFRTTDDLWLIPTAEVPLTNLVAGEILGESDLPQRFTALTQCFRSEAGAAGKDTSGMLRQHQFSKVELVSVTHPDRSDEEHERMTACAEEVLKRLGLHFRTVVLSSGDMGFSARKTYDIEVWLPGQGTYREISSCSNCGDFQARRMNARFRTKGEKGAKFVHTLNGSGLAVGRTLIAVMENYQREDGSIEIPEALRPYMGGITVIGADG